MSKKTIAAKAITDDIKELMSGWDKIHSAAKVQFPNKSAEEIFQIASGAMNHALGSPTTMNPKIIKGSWKDKDSEVMAAQHAPFTFINSNGSKWAGQEADDIETLLDVLEKYALDATYEEYGNFIVKNPCIGVINPKWDYSNNEKQYIDGPRLFKVEGVTHFSGNFFLLSHCFAIFTNDPATIQKITAAIRNNQKREDYKSQKVA